MDIKIRVAHRDRPRSSTEEMILSWDNENWMFTLYHTDNRGNPRKPYKRHSRISYRRWEKKDITVEKFRGSSLEGYRFLEVERKIIWIINCGIKDPELFGSVIEEDESKNS
jgi:hypothetical protein